MSQLGVHTKITIEIIKPLYIFTRSGHEFINTVICLYLYYSLQCYYIRKGQHQFDPASRALC